MADREVDAVVEAESESHALHLCVESHVREQVVVHKMVDHDDHGDYAQNNEHSIVVRVQSALRSNVINQPDCFVDDQTGKYCQ